MEAILSFFSDLILFTAGIGVALFWIALIIAISVEVHDLIFGDPGEKKEES